MDNYEILDVIGEGQNSSRTYGTVYRAKHKQLSTLFAIKKFKESQDEEHVKKTAVRQIRMLRSLKHNNIVSLLDYFCKNKQLYLIFEYVEKTVLNDLQRHPTGLSLDYIKRLIHQLVTATNFCHKKNVKSTQIVHRDIKPQNLLVSSSGVLKLCDFGFARTLTTTGGPLTDYVSTRWYRAPELLVGSTSYGKAVDVWSIGCILAELITGVPLFPGDSDMDTLQCIMNLLGDHLTEAQIKAFREQTFYQQQTVRFKQLPFPQKQDSLEQKFSSQPRACLRFLQVCLKYDPKKRPSCEELLKHEFLNDSFRKSAQVGIHPVNRSRKQLIQKSTSENNTPEPSKSLNRAITPKRVTMKSINSNLEQKRDEYKRISYGSFLPDLKRKEEESFNSGRCKKSKVGYLNHSTIERKKKQVIPYLKLADIHQNHEKLTNLSIIYQNNSSNRQLSFRGRNQSRSNLKSRPNQHLYFHSITPVPPSVKSIFTNQSKLKVFKSKHFIKQKKNVKHQNKIEQLEC